ncbi:MAG: hypothetical protein LBS04_00485 [Tannerellaceae bacterium]|jgi:hypothetical protein|nr:hypothetical protein [Tannerellaceae bacterium]
MKKKLSILFIAIASFILLALAVVSHHHHEGLPCIVTEHRDLPGDSEQETCIVESEYTAPKTIDEIKNKIVSYRNHDFNHLFPVFFLAADFLSFATEISTSGSKCGEYRLLLYKSSDANLFHGLRAPPFVIS